MLLTMVLALVLQRHRLTLQLGARIDYQLHITMSPRGWHADARRAPGPPVPAEPDARHPATETGARLMRTTDFSRAPDIGQATAQFVGATHFTGPRALLGLYRRWRPMIRRLKQWP